MGDVVGGPFANFYDRASIWLDRSATNYDATGSSFQLVQGLLASAPAGCSAPPGAGSPGSVPEVRSDFIFAGMGEEMACSACPRC